MKWGLAWRIVDTLLGIAIRADELADRRRARKKLELLGEAKRKDEQAARSRAKTVVLPRPEPPTSPQTASAARAPSAPSKAPPRRR